MKKVKLDDESTLDGLPLSERYARFIGRFVETGNQMHAYRTSFVVDKKASAQWVYEQAESLLADPVVQKRVRELWDTAASATLFSVQALIKDWQNIVAADPNELISHVLDNCRFCRGDSHRYQWKGEQEYAQACDRAMQMDQPAPDCSGGFDYNPTLEPVMTCPSCFGRGLSTVLVRDTTKLSEQAKALYLGVKATKNGMEVIMADKQKARESLARIAGVFKDGIPIAPVAPNPAAIPEGATQEAAARAYLRVVGS